MSKMKWINNWKIWAGVVTGTALLVLAYVLFSNRTTVPAVQIFQPTRTQLVDYVTSNGKIEPIDAHVFRAQFDTFVTSATAKDGQPVRRGQTILRLDANEVRADLAKARIELLESQENLRNDRGGGPPDERAQVAGDLRRAQADVDHLQSRQQTLEKLLQTHASTEDEVSQNSTALERARALFDALKKKQGDIADRAAIEEKSDSLGTQQAEEKIKLLENRLQSATVTADLDGTLYSFPLHQGDFVHAGDVLAEIADLRKVRLRAFVDETDLGQIKLDQPVKITWDAMPEKSWTGKTVQIPRQVLARGTRSIAEVLCSVENDKLELLPNVNVDVQILVQENDRALVVPRGAVRTEQDKHFVLVLDGDRLRRREVQLGMGNATSYEIVSGLNENDQVALTSNASLRDGTLVRASETK